MIYLGSDHGGYDLKQDIMKWLDENNFEYEDLGNTENNPQDDYPIYAFKVGEKVASEYDGSLSWKDNSKGILFCRSSAGVVIAVNKVKGISCSSAFNEISAKKAREHNATNVLALSGDWLKKEDAIKVLSVWLETKFSDEVRHVRRLNMIKEYEMK